MIIRKNSISSLSEYSEKEDIIFIYFRKKGYKKLKKFKILVQIFRLHLNSHLHILSLQYKFWSAYYHDSQTLLQMSFVGRVKFSFLSKYWNATGIIFSFTCQHFLIKCSLFFEQLSFLHWPEYIKAPSETKFLC